AIVVNPGDTPTKLAVTYDDVPLNVPDFAYIPSGSGREITYSPLGDGVVPPRQVAILFLAAAWDTRQKGPWITSPAIRADLSIDGTGYGKAFHVKSAAPVVMFDIFPYGGGNSAITAASLLFPTSAWDTNYLAVTPQPGSGPKFDPWIALV